MKIEKFKVLLFLKKTEPDKSGKAPIMGRITLNRTVAQFSTKLACTPKLWNVRENRLEGKSREAVETNAKIEKLLLAIHAAFNELQERKHDFAAADVRNLFQGSMETQMTLLRLFDRHIEETRERIGIDVCASSMSTYHYARKTLGEFVRKKYKVKDIAFGALNEQFIREYQSYIEVTCGYSNQTSRHHLALLKRICRIAYKEGFSEWYHFLHFKIPKQKETTPKALSREDFEKLRDLDIPEKRRSLVLTRDLFLFACYSGTAYADTISITRENLYTDDEGRLWLKYRRKKNELKARVKLLPEAIALIEKYRDDSRETLFPNQLYSTLRANMKILRVLAGLTTELVYHYFRHDADNEFTVWTIKSPKTKPWQGYNTDPYAYAVRKLYERKGYNEYELNDCSDNAEHGALYIRTEGSETNAMYMECYPKGWKIGIWDKRQKVARKFGNRFEAISDTEGNAVGFKDVENIFSFDGLVLLDLPGKDRIQTALAFLEAIS